MKVVRPEFLQVLETVQAGIAARETEAQSSCFVFKDGKIFTYNGEIALHRAYKPIRGLTGAVVAKPLLAVLAKIPDEDIELAVTEDHSQLIITAGRSRKSGIRLDKEILLDLSQVEEPVNWEALNEDFNDAINVAQECALKKDTTSFALTCIHLHPEFVEACDNFRVLRYPCLTGVRKPTLVKREAVRHILGLDMTEFCETKGWLHFRNPLGIVLSCRRYREKFNDFDESFKIIKPRKIVLPGGLAEALATAEIFSGERVEDNEVTVTLRPDLITITGEGSLGWYKERKKAKYDGPDMEFKISPKLLTEITKRSNECTVGNNMLLKVDTGKFVCVSCLTDPNAPTPVPEEAEEVVEA